MSEYIERQKALDTVFRSHSVEGAHKFLAAIKPDDVRPVVLCRDCRHRDPEDHKCDSGEMERQGCPFKVADNYFCAYGER